MTAVYTMTKHLHLLFLFVSLAGSGFSASAIELVDTFKTDASVYRVFPEKTEREKTVKSTKLIGMNVPDSLLKSTSDSAYAMIGKFYADQFRNFQDPRAPYFMFMSKNADLAMGIGGVVRMRGWFDWNGTIPVNGFSPYFIQIPKDPTAKRRLDATPAGTAIFLTILAHKPWLGYLTAYIEGNFDGYEHVGFKLKKAYVTLNDITVGYAPSTFSDPASQAPTIDGAGSNGKVSRTNILVRYMHTFKNRWTIGGSFEFPKSSPDVIDGQTKKCADYVPDVAAMAQYQWDEGLSHLRLSGLLRVMSYRDLISNRNRNVVGWGAMVSGMWKVFKPLTLYGSVSVGQGHASYQGEFAAGNFDLVGDFNNPGKLYAPTSFGITAGLKYNFLYNLYACVSLGQMQYCPKHHLSDDQYKRGLYGAVNMFWDITPRIQVGAEYLCGKRTNFNGQHANANRVDALFQFSF